MVAFPRSVRLSAMRISRARGTCLEVSVWVPVTKGEEKLYRDTDKQLRKKLRTMARVDHLIVTVVEE